MGKNYVRKTDRPYRRMTEAEWQTVLEYCHEPIGKVALRINRNPNGLQKLMYKARAIRGIV